MTGLPLQPSRDNSARDCELVEGPGREPPKHIEPCSCPNHTGVCEECGYKITVAASGREYGHARAYNRCGGRGGISEDCSHRPAACDPGQGDFHDSGEREGSA